MAGGLRNPRYAIDTLNGGGYRITGTVDRLGVVGRYRVRLFDARSGALLREQTSAADGTYAFKFIAYKYRGYFVVAHDAAENPSPQNAAIADLITPELMP